MSPVCPGLCPGICVSSGCATGAAFRARLRRLMASRSGSSLPVLLESATDFQSTLLCRGGERITISSYLRLKNRSLRAVRQSDSGCQRSAACAQRLSWLVKRDDGKDGAGRLGNAARFPLSPIPGFRWHADADLLLGKIERDCKRISDSGYYGRSRRKRARAVLY